MTKLGRRRLVGRGLGAYVIGAITVFAGVCYGSGGAALAFVKPLIRLPEFMLGMAPRLAFAEGWRPSLDVRLPVARPVPLCLSVVCLICPNP